MRITGRSAGGVRPPLTDLTDSELGELEAILSNAFGAQIG